MASLRFSGPREWSKQEKVSPERDSATRGTQSFQGMGNSADEGFRLHPAPAPPMPAPFHGLTDFPCMWAPAPTGPSSQATGEHIGAVIHSYGNRPDGEALQALEVGSCYLGKNSVAGVSL